MPNCPIPNFHTYNSLVNDVGKVYAIKIEFSSDIDDENINGCFRDLREYLPLLAKFYFNMQGKRKGEFKWFRETKGRFLVAFGGDGCPGKNESTCSFLIKFLNARKKVASNSTNFFNLWG